MSSLATKALRSIAVDEFEQLCRDDPHFERNWGDSFAEWYVQVFLPSIEEE